MPSNSVINTEFIASEMELRSYLFGIYSVSDFSIEALETLLDEIKPSEYPCVALFLMNGEFAFIYEDQFSSLYKIIKE